MACHQLAKFGGHKHQSLIEMEISILISILTWAPWKKLNSPPRSAILGDFQNQDYRFTIPKSRIRLAEKREEEEEEHRQQQSVMRFKQTQKVKATGKTFSLGRYYLSNIHIFYEQLVFWTLSQNCLVYHLKFLQKASYQLFIALLLFMQLLQVQG